MAAKRKKRSKRIILFAPIFWILLVANVVLGLALSRITSPVKVRAENIPAFDQPRITEILEKLSDIPSRQVNSRAVESKVMSLPDVDQAELTTNIFGNALLKVVYRRPVATLASRPKVALDSDGTLFESSEIPDGLPQLELPSGGPPTMATFAGNWQPTSLAALSVYALAKYPKSLLRIQVDQRGAVCLNIDSGRVILGSCDDLDLKLKTLESRLQKNPQELTENVELNLTVPSVPAIVPRTVGKKN